MKQLDVFELRDKPSMKRWQTPPMTRRAASPIIAFRRPIHEAVAAPADVLLKALPQGSRTHST